MNKIARLKSEILAAVNSAGMQITVEALRTALKKNGHLGLDDNGTLLGSACKLFQRAKDDLRWEGALSQDGEFLRRVK